MSSTVLRSAKNGIRSVSSVSCLREKVVAVSPWTRKQLSSRNGRTYGSLNQLLIGTALFGWNT